MYLHEDSLYTMVRLSNRSWWQAMEYGGKIYSEWETLQNTSLTPLGSGNSSRWEDIPKRNLVAVRILCPNGEIGELRSREGGLFFQFKIGSLMIGAGQFCHAHVIGAVLNEQGDCLCRAWEPQQWKLTEFRDNVRAMKYRNVGALSFEVQGLRV